MTRELPCIDETCTAPAVTVKPVPLCDGCSIETSLAVLPRLLANLLNQTRTEAERHRDATEAHAEPPQASPTSAPRQGLAAHQPERSSQQRKQIDEVLNLIDELGFDAVKLPLVQRRTSMAKTTAHHRLNDARAEYQHRTPLNLTDLERRAVDRIRSEGQPLKRSNIAAAVRAEGGSIATDRAGQIAVALKQHAVA